MSIGPLSISNDLLAYFLADPLAPLLGVSHLKDDVHNPLSGALNQFLLSLPSDAVEEAMQDPDLAWLRAGDSLSSVSATARENVAVQLLSVVVPTHRLVALALQSPRPLPYAHPALDDLVVTDEGLVNLRAFQFDGSVLEHNGYLFLPAPATQSPNSGHWLLQHLAQPDLKDATWIRLDPYMFGPIGKFPRMRYLMFLYGRPLDWGRLSKLKEPEYGRWLPADTTHDVMLTDFVWERRDSELHFVCEELPNEHCVGSRGGRYLHAIYDLDANMVTHLDGALRIYDLDSLRERAHTHVRHAGKCGNRVKLFRTDKWIPRERLADVAVAFFVWNYDVTNYFGPQDRPSRSRIGRQHT